MSKIHQQPTTTKVPKSHDIGHFDAYKLEQTEFSGVSFHTVKGSTEHIQAAPVDRLMIVVSGFANTLDTKLVIRDGAVIEIKANEIFSYQGQMKYFLISR